MQYKSTQMHKLQTRQTVGYDRLQETSCSHAAASVLHSQTLQQATSRSGSVNSAEVSAVELPAQQRQLHPTKVKTSWSRAMTSLQQDGKVVSGLTRGNNCEETSSIAQESLSGAVIQDSPKKQPMSNSLKKRYEPQDSLLSPSN